MEIKSEELFVVFVLPCKNAFFCLFFFVLTGVTNHPIDSSQLVPVNPVKPEGVRSNGPSQPEREAPPPVPDNDSNGCSKPSAPNHDRNGSVDSVAEHAAEVAHERPAKKCRTEAEPLSQSEVEPSRAHEKWRVHLLAEENRNKLIPASFTGETGRRSGASDENKQLEDL